MEWEIWAVWLLGLLIVGLISGLAYSEISEGLSEGQSQDMHTLRAVSASLRMCTF